MSVLAFSEEQGWTNRQKTIIKYSGSDEPTMYRFQWPKWAIDETNMLIKNGKTPNEAVKIVSAKLDLEREQHAISY